VPIGKGSFTRHLLSRVSYPKESHEKMLIGGHMRPGVLDNTKIIDNILDYLKASANTFRVGR